MIDLHMHTKYSDGTDTVIELLKRAQEKELEMISITDHDNCNAYEELKNIQIEDYYNGKIISGVELKTMIEGINIELLGYGINPDIINERVKKMYITQTEKNLIEINRLYQKCIRLGIIFDDDFFEKYDKSEYSYATDYLHERLIDKIENKKFIKDEESWNDNAVFYRNYISNPNSELYTNMSDVVPSCEEVIKLIRDAGGLVFIAHIFIYGVNSEKVLDEVTKNYKIDGIECIYSSFTTKQTEFLINFCRENNLYISGGSDYHGKYHPNIEIGIGHGNLNMSYDIIKEWVDKIKS